MLPSPEKRKKTFVIDTNVILHDSSCIEQFEENDIVLPITVLEELDHFKKGNNSVNYHAREFVRSLDSISGDKLFTGGLRIGPKQGTVLIKLAEPLHENLKLNFSGREPDHNILNTAYRLAERAPKTDVILVTKDVNLRMKAKSIGLLAQDYTTDHVADVSALYTGLRIETAVPAAAIDSLYEPQAEIPATALSVEEKLRANEFLIMKNGKKSALARFVPSDQVIRRVEKTPAYGITPRNAEQTFALNALLDDSVKLVSLSGKAGTGKTLLALAAALERRKNYRQIYIARPIVPLSNKDIGYLPGDIQSKLNPYMQPLYDNLGVIKNQFSASSPKYKRIDDLLTEEKLMISPLSYIRGRSLVKIYFIVDEAQNLTPHEIKTIITRAGEGTKIVFTGDIFQIDHPYLDSQSNGLSYLIEKMQGQHLYAHVNLEKGERSELAELASDLL
ncbi:MAG: PhoH family protein [Lentisphaerae bacterium]|jgi:PhoH-like ATPase|nr:PhoH family protein [Lentisphaerota bacterium]MBT4822125.1 PhoH family protein [Lentisphaerota bacterium]MBT5605883.1 PhoH family protein [Lentisphaerota bacterium]MBT7057962.1 PhoH family protein [Lentisphaerota bacterium]MBT7848517.1 PhoH family protein [Lentisphaerota bacterium]